MTERKVIKPYFAIFNGLLMNCSWHEKDFLDALNYKPRDDDTFVVSYPKCGTTWFLQIVHLLLNNGKIMKNSIDALIKTPFLDRFGPSLIEMSSPHGVIKSHLPFNLIPWNPKAKYIYGVRNPKDCCVSFYYHTRDILSYRFENGTFDDFFNCFINGEVSYGDYFDHLISWWEHRNHPNVLIVTYEEAKEDIVKLIFKIAHFLGDDNEQNLKDNPKLLHDIIKYCGFEFMKQSDMIYEVNDHFNSNIKEDMKILIESLPESVKQHLKNFNRDDNDRSDRKSNVQKNKYERFRNGQINDWKNHFSDEQNEQIKKKFIERTNGTGIESLWKDMN